MSTFHKHVKIAQLNKSKIPTLSGFAASSPHEVSHQGEPVICNETENQGQYWTQREIADRRGARVEEASPKITRYPRDALRGPLSLTLLNVSTELLLSVSGLLAAHCREIDTRNPQG
jgi:hypothetical protein